jgi:hypothetical protein
MNKKVLIDYLIWFNDFGFSLGVVFDVPKPDVDVHEDVIALTRAKCKRILAEMKQKMFVEINFII